ncbi:MAG TPA: hypothetical protein VFG20_06155 [Planctomycetaceae bacterium]|nr:hypothetical protein [Planctomycetaceae bacterium]
MPNWDRARWDAAQQIVKALLAEQAASPFPTFPDSQIQALHRLRQRWHYAVARGWQVAAATMQNTWNLHLEWLINDLKARRCRAPSRAAITLTAAQVYRDLAGLQDEFEFVDIDSRARTVTVRTDRIMLDDVDLGPFAIVWSWGNPDDSLRVIAEEPQRPDYPEDLTHPHVREDELCVGDGQAALDQAFRSGRLFDAFLILRQILKTYNPHSAYASLWRWTGRVCRGCAGSVSEDESWSCETCGEVFCGDCSQCCDACGDPVCQGCSSLCSDCETRICSRCRAVVDGRRLSVCQACYETPTPDEEADDETQETPLRPDKDDASFEAHVLTDHVGEAALPAGCG